MAAVTAGVIGAAGAIGGAVISSRASGRASDAQQDASDQNIALQREIYQQNRADLAPQRQTGNYAHQLLAQQFGVPTYDPNDRTFDGGGYQGSFDSQRAAPGTDLTGNVVSFPGGPQTQGTLGRLPQGDRYGSFFASPGYQFNFDEGIRGANATASAGGYLGSGRAAKEAAQYASGLASQEYGNYINGLANIAGTGTVATNNSVAAANSFANNAGNSILRAGDARASGIVGSANAINQGINGVAQGVGIYAGGRT